MFYTPSVPETTSSSTQLSNIDLNALGSQYATLGSHNTTALIQRVVRSIIYDSAPQQYADLLILNQKNMLKVDDDVWNFHEMGWGRSPLLNKVTAGVAGGASQTVPVQNPSDVSVNMIILYPDNSRGTVTAIAGDDLTVTAMTGETLPAIPASAAGTYNFSILSPVMADGQEGAYSYFRQYTTERYNFVQLLDKAMRMGLVELGKYTKNGTTSNYLTMQKQKMIEQFRVDLSNIYWNGKRGEVTIKSGNGTVKAKTAGGIFPTMVDAASSNATCTLANAPATLETLALDTEYRVYGYKRFIYAAPRVILALSKEYKSDLTRYAPDNMIAKLNLKELDLGSSQLVFVPMRRFEDPSCFPEMFRNMLFCLDQESISPVSLSFVPERMFQTLNRKNGILKGYLDTLIEASFSTEFKNPNGSFYMTISDLA